MTIWVMPSLRCCCISWRCRYSRSFLPAPTRKDANMYLSLKVHEPTSATGELNQLDYARSIVRGEAAALEQVAQRLDDSFLEAVDLLHRCTGRVGITGTG